MVIIQWTTQILEEGKKMPNFLSLNLACFSFLKIQLYIGIRQKYKIYLGFHYALGNIVWKNLPIKIAFFVFPRMSERAYIPDVFY